MRRKVTGAAATRAAAAPGRFTPGQVVGLTLAVIATNGWNRLCRAFQIPAGEYASPHGADAHAAP